MFENELSKIEGLSRRGRRRAFKEAQRRREVVNSINLALNLSADTSRGQSPAIWADCPIAEIQEDNRRGVFFRDDFLSFPKTPATTEGNWGSYAQFASATGAITAGTGEGGEAVFGATEDDEGVSIRTLATPFKLSRATHGFWFECRIKTSTIADTKHGFFVGLLENVALTATVPIAAAGTLTDNNFVGFHRLEGDGDYVNTVYKANTVTQVTVQQDAQVLVADTYVKLGMKLHQYDGNNPRYNLVFYGNNQRLTTDYTMASADGTDFPNDVGLGLAFALLNATGTAEGTTTMDWWQAAQTYF